MKKLIPTITIEQLNACDSGIKMRVDIRRLEVHKNLLSPADFPHRHDFYNLIFITQGSGTHTIDLQEFEVKPNQMYCMNDGQVHSWELSEDIEGYTLFFKKEFYEVIEPKYSLQALPFFNLGANDSSLVEFSDEMAQIVSRLFEEIIREYQTNLPDREISIKSYLKLILINAWRTYMPHEELDNNDLNVSKVRFFEQLINQKFKELKAVKDFADIMHITPNYLNAICTKAVGKTAGQMIRERVILEAKRLLLHSSISVCELAYHLGYEDCSYFIRLFKKEVGTTPEYFRINQR